MTVQTFVRILGITFIAIAVAGTLTGTHAHTLIIFGVNMPHNVVHMLSGVAAILASGLGPRAARNFCRIFGVVYGAVTIAGFAGVEPVVRYLNLNTADNWLHLAISGSCLIYGFSGRKRSHRTRSYRHDEAMAA